MHLQPTVDHVTYPKRPDVRARRLAAHEVAAQPRDVLHELKHVLVVSLRVHMQVVKVVACETQVNNLRSVEQSGTHK